MNILFYTHYKVSPTKGGTERTTISVATGLCNHGYKCYSLYRVDADTPKEACFEEEFLLNKIDTEKIRRLIVEKHIKWLVCQGVFSMVPCFKSAMEGTSCRLAFVHHFEPGGEENFFQNDRLRSSFKVERKRKVKLVISIRIFLFPYFKRRHKRKLKEEYRLVYEQADRVVLLCKEFIPQFMTYGNIQDNKKFYIIPNGLSYDEWLPVFKIEQKKPIALIVSRLDDPPKRISLALKIWDEVKKKKESEGWTLKIVGHGPDENKYRTMILKHKIPDVYLLGRQQPKSYYEESSIFLMTSKSEGWGLTLTEAQQFGVVPIAFDSYASLQNIIEDGTNGLVVQECDVNQYVEKLAELMGNRKKREILAENAINSSMRFSKEIIVKEWINLLEN